MGGLLTKLRVHKMTMTKERIRRDSTDEEVQDDEDVDDDGEVQDDPEGAISDKILTLTHDLMSVIHQKTEATQKQNKGPTELSANETTQRTRKRAFGIEREAGTCATAHVDKEAGTIPSTSQMVIKYISLDAKRVMRPPWPKPTNLLPSIATQRYGAVR